MRTPVLLVALLIVGAGCGKKKVDTPPAAPPPDVAATPAKAGSAAVLFENGFVVVKEVNGTERWRVPVKGYLGSVRPPDRILEGNRVIVVADNELVALDAKDGRRVWEAPGPADRLHVHASTVLTTDCSSPSSMDRTRWVIGRRIEDGVETFRVEIPRSVDPNPIVRVENTFFVGDAKSTTVIGIEGKKRFALDEGLIVAHPIGEDWLLATTKRIARFGRNGALRWERPVLRNTFVGNGGVVPIDKEDVVVFGYSAIADSGVELVRVSLGEGIERWRSFAKPAGVGHSEYEHNADVVLKNGVLHVSSRGSYASFDETFSSDDGVSLSRSVINR